MDLDLDLTGRRALVTGSSTGIRADLRCRRAGLRRWGDHIPKAEEYFDKGTGQTVGRVGEVSEAGISPAVN